MDYNADFRNHQERYHSAVSMTLPSLAVQDPAAQLVSWINHHGTYTIAELRVANIAFSNSRMRMLAVYSLAGSTSHFN